MAAITSGGVTAPPVCAAYRCAKGSAPAQRCAALTPEVIGNVSSEWYNLCTKVITAQEIAQSSDEWSGTSDVAGGPAVDATPPNGGAADEGPATDGHDTIVDVLFVDTAHGAEVGPETDSEPTLDILAETSPAEVSQPTDVSLVTSCEPKPLMAIFAEAKAKGVPGYVYVLGGFVKGDPDLNPDFGIKSATVQRLDLASGVWSTAGILPELRQGGMATWVAGSTWLMGGLSCSPGDKPFKCPSDYPSVCGELTCHEMWRRGPDNIWKVFGFGVAGSKGYKGFLPAGCSVLYAGSSLLTFGAETGTVVSQVDNLPGESKVALAPWQDGFALLGGVEFGAKASNAIVLLDAAGKPTGKTLPAPPCGVVTPRMWSTTAHLFVMDYHTVPTSSTCAGTLEETWQAGIPHTRPVAWDGKSWSVAPTIPGVKGSEFVQTPVGIFHIGSQTGTPAIPPMLPPTA